MMYIQAPTLYMYLTPPNSIIKSVHRIETALVGFRFVFRYENAY